MKRTELQQKLSIAAKTLATKLQKNSYQPALASYAYTLKDGKPGNTVGFMLRQAGITFEKETSLFDATEAVAKALGTTSDVLPAEVVEAVRDIRKAEITRYTSPARRRAVVKPLRQFAELIVGAKIRKPYTKSGMYTAAARAAGTFGVQTQPAAF